MGFMSKRGQVVPIPTTHDFRQSQNSARDGDSSGRPTGKEEPMPAPTTLPASSAGRPDRMVRLTLRMLGQNITYRRGQWEELLDELDQDSGLAARVRELLEWEPTTSPEQVKREAVTTIDNALAEVMETRKALDEVGERMPRVGLGLAADQMLDVRNELTGGGAR